MEEDYILAKNLAARIEDENEVLQAFFTLGIYGIIRIFPKNKDIIERIVEEVNIIIDDKPINKIMREHGYNPDDYFGTETGEDIVEGEVSSYAVSFSGNNYILCNECEFVNEKINPFIICSTLNCDEAMLLSSFVHEFAHLVKGTVNNTYLTNDGKYFGYVIRSGLSIFEFSCCPKADEYYEDVSYEILDEVINCLQTTEACQAILELEGIISDEEVRQFFDLLNKERLSVDRGYQEAGSAFKPLWNNPKLKALISDNLVEGNINYIIQEFDKIAGDGSFDLLDELLFKIDGLDCKNLNDSLAMATTKSKVQELIDIFNRNSKDYKNYQKNNDFSN